MDAATLAAFCNARELTFVETGIRDGAKGAWFVDRKFNRRFIQTQEVLDSVSVMRATSQRQLRLA